MTRSPESLVNVKSGASSPSSTTRPSSRRAIGVVRVSRVGDREGERFVSKSDQVERIRSTCARDGLEVVDVIEELDVSGGTPLEKRSGLRRAVELVEAWQADVVVVAYFDRLVRSLAVQREVVERVENAGGAILAVDVGEVRADTASRWLSSTMLGMVAEYHRRVTAERTEDAKRRAVARGVAPFPNLPFYLRRDSEGRIEHDPEGVKVMRKAVRLRLEGATIANVRSYLQEHGVTVSYHGTQSLLGSRMLLGELRFGDLVNSDSHPPVVDAATWQAVQRMRSPRGRRPKSERLLARLGILRCATCGARMVTGTANHGRYVLYRCPPIGDCPQRVTISADVAEHAVVEAAKDAIEGMTGSASLVEGVEDAEREFAAAEHELDAAILAFTGLDDVVAAQERLADLRRRRDQAQERLAELQAATAPAITVSAGDWDLLTLEEQRALIRAVIDEAVVYPGRGPDRITVKTRSE